MPREFDVDDCYRRIDLPMSFEQFDIFPNLPAFKNEYYDGKLVLTPRPKMYHARLDLERFLRIDVGPIEFHWGDRDYDITPLQECDWSQLAGPLVAAYARQQPFESLPKDERAAASAKCLDMIRSGGEGPVIVSACRVYRDRADESPTAAILITLAQDTDDFDLYSTRWRKPPPPNAIANRLGRPHLTWIFVPIMMAGHGIGSNLLRSAAAALRELGYEELLSTFMRGNDSSTLWHWRNGFELLPYMASPRSIRRSERESACREQSTQTQVRSRH
jgi:hypothetical protein